MRISPTDAQANRELLLAATQRREAAARTNTIDRQVDGSQRTQRVFDAATVRTRAGSPASPPAGASEPAPRSDYAERVAAARPSFVPASPTIGADAARNAERIANGQRPERPGDTPPNPKKLNEATPGEPVSAKPIDAGSRGENAPFTEADVDAVRGAFGSAAGERRFNPNYDLDQDGSINADDLLAVLSLVGTDKPSPIGPPASDPPPVGDDQPFVPADLDAVKSAFGSSAGERRFNPNYDLNGDGAIDTTDLLQVLNHIHTDQTERAEREAA